ncbi:MAG: protein-disulfide reductase DsbD N-terminal domain-containing protein [Acidobacteriia bacterium]|nr:protein-disulfide reductase DsbD N-terminal domain-containing protein [Terriglobia bacterium]
MGKFAVVFVALLISAAALAQVETSKPKATQRVTAAPIAPVVVHAGSSKQVELTFRVAPGYHINSHKPTSELLIATVLSVSPPTNIAVAKLTYPAGVERSFPFSPSEKLSVYAGDFTLTALVRAARTTPPGRYRVHCTLQYQACDDRACYPPGKVPVAFDVKVSKAGTGHTRRNPAQSPHVHQ